MDTPENLFTASAAHACGRAGLTVLPTPLPRFAPLVPLVAADAEITPDLDRMLTAAARAAHAGDSAARNALYFALEPKIARFAARFRRRGWATGSAWDYADVTQEAFVVFADLVAGWPGEGSFAPYFLDLFPRRLGGAVRLLDGPCPDPAGRGAGADPTALQDESADAAAATALLVELTEGLDPIDARILLWRARDRAPFGEIAARLQLNRRTVCRRWQSLLGELRPLLDGARSG